MLNCGLIVLVILNVV